MCAEPSGSPEALWSEISKERGEEVPRLCYQWSLLLQEGPGTLLEVLNQSDVSRETAQHHEGEWSRFTSAQCFEDNSKAFFYTEATQTLPQFPFHSSRGHLYDM